MLYHLQVRNLSYKNILTQVKFEWSQGERLALMGANGSGKSTLAKLLAGQIKADAGEILLRHNGEIYPREKSLSWKNIGYVGQHPRRHTIGATVAEELGFGLLNLGLSAAEVKDKVRSLASQIGMLEHLQQSPSTLSGGERQRLVIAAILALHPAFIILDESVSMLDPKAEKRIFDLIDSANITNSDSNVKGLGQLWITHDPEVALRADRLLVLQEGNLVAEGNPSDILKDEKQCLEYRIRSQTKALIHGYAINHSSITCQMPPVLKWDKAEFKNKVYADQTVDKNQFIGIVGPSGAGKTTLLESALNLIKPIKGEFKAFDYASNPIPMQELRNRIRLLQQEAGEYILGRTVYDEVFYTKSKILRQADRAKDEAYLNSMAIPEKQWRRDPERLSGGERQRIALAAALSTYPDIVLFDEPMIGLDCQGREQFRAFLMQYKDNHTILYVTHDLSEIADLVTRIWLIEDGKVALDCKIEDFTKERDRFERAGVKL